MFARLFLLVTILVFVLASSAEKHAKHEPVLCTEDHSELKDTLAAAAAMPLVVQNDPKKNYDPSDGSHYHDQIAALKVDETPNPACCG